MAAPAPDVPIQLFLGAEIEMIAVGASSIQLVLNDCKKIALDYYGTLDYKGDWLYNAPLCGQDSVQNLVGQCIAALEVDEESTANISLSGGKVIKIDHRGRSFFLMRFIVGDKEYEL